MARKAGSGAVLASGLIVLSVGCIAIGYGLCAIVNGMEGGPVLTGMGGGAVALATIFIVRSQQPPPAAHSNPE